MNKRLSIVKGHEINKINELVATENEENLRLASENLDKMRLEYKESKQKKWIIASIGAIGLMIAIHHLQYVIF